MRIRPVASSSCCGWLAAALALTSFVITANGQQYRSDTPDKASRAYGASARVWVTNPAIYAADKEHFKDYFEKYYFPKMTSTDDIDLGKLGSDLRYNLFKQFLWATNNTQLQQDLTGMAYHAMGQIVLDPSYHPAVRYNAILVIGLLDEQYSNNGRQAPKPLPGATKALTGIVNAATTSNRFSPYLILGALIGLDRHAQLHASLTPEAISAMTSALIKLVTHDKPIQEMDPDAYAWMRIRAASALANLGSVGDQNAVHNALIKLITSSKSLDDRCEVAGMLDRLVYKDAKLDDAGTAEPLFALARDVADAEDKRAQDFQNLYGTTGGARPVSRYSPGGPGGGDTDQQETYPRRQVLARLTGLDAALAKVKPALPTETQAKVETLVKAIDAAKTAAANKDTGELNLAAAIRTMARLIRATVPPPPEKPPAEKAKITASPDKPTAAAVPKQ